MEIHITFAINFNIKISISAIFFKKLTQHEGVGGICDQVASVAPVNNKHMIINIDTH